MKTALISLLIGIGFLILIYLVLGVGMDKSSVDIHLYDTFYVLDYRFVFVFLLLYLGTFFSIGGLLGTKFKSKLFWVLMVLFLLIDVYFVISLNKFI